MSTKTISITEEAYGRLSNRKRTGESFSEVINRLTNRRSLTEFAGILSKESARELEQNISKNRLASSKRMMAGRFLG